MFLEEEEEVRAVVAEAIQTVLRREGYPNPYEVLRDLTRTNARIDPGWVEQQGRHLLRYTHFDPHWSRRRGAVLAWEQVTLYGLVVVEKRRVAYETIDPAEARRIFIRHALVRGELDTRAAFKAHNEKIRAEVEALEHKRRKRDVLADEHVLFDFFDARIPAHVTGARSFENWLSGLEGEQRRLLYLGHDTLLREQAGQAPAELFPDEIEFAGRRFQLDYHFEPGHAEDGVSLTVPLEWLNVLDPGRLQWLVPGLMRDKLVALIRQLPKPLRRALTPVPQFADALAEALRERASEPMLAACAAELQRMTGLEVPLEALDEHRIEDHFRFLIRVVGPDGGVLETGRDLAGLQERHGRRAQRRFMDRQGAGFNRDGETEWTFDRLETRVRTDAGAVAWPALVDQDDAVGLRLFDTWEEAALAHHDGVLRLLRLRLADKLPEAIYTPSTKAEVGDHDINIDFQAIADMIGLDLAEQVRQASIQVYEFAVQHAAQRGIIIADTKFEFGFDDSGTIVWMDEALTPDSSRFWPADEYEPGRSPASYDKQYVRDWATASGWDKLPPAPEIPDDVVQALERGRGREAAGDLADKALGTILDNIEMARTTSAPSTPWTTARPRSTRSARPSISSSTSFLPRKAAACASG